MSQFKRDHNRYLVAKVKDAAAALEPEELAELKALLTKVDLYRARNFKPSLKCVVVEADWPEYEVVWDMLRERTIAERN